MSRIRLKVIEKKIVEKDFSEIVTTKFETIEDQIKEIKRRFEFDQDKTLMNEMINIIKNNN